MTGEIVDFAAKREEREAEIPHLAGPAFCSACKHEWMAVAPIGTVEGLECPKCSRIFGAFKHEVAPKMAWQCNCGNILFWLTPEGAMCRKCGIVSHDWAN